MAVPKMKFCLNIVHDRPYAETLEWWKAADEAGIDFIGMPDSPARLRELYVSSAYCLLNTPRINVLTSVTNPVTRHPSVTAGALVSLNELAPGRVSLGIATGDGALWSIGMTKAATVARLREYILTVKSLLRGEEVEYRGRGFQARWRGGLPEGSEIPIYVACSGPRVLRMASQVADGLVIQMGYGTENLEYIKGIINEGCAEAARDPSDLDIWWTTELIFGATPEESKKQNLGVNIGWLALTSLDGKQIPEEYREPLVKLIDDPGLSSSYEDPAWGEFMVGRAKELGIYDWIVSRAPGLWGTPDDVSQRLAELGEQGLTNWMFYVGRPNVDRLDLINKLGKGVIPNFA